MIRFKTAVNRKKFQEEVGYKVLSGGGGHQKGYPEPGNLKGTGRRNRQIQQTLPERTESVSRNTKKVYFRHKTGVQSTSEGRLTDQRGT